MANDVRRKVLEAFVANLEESQSLAPGIIEKLEGLFESGDKVSADEVIAVLKGPDDGPEAGAA